jgi:C4-dicarboxylate transporter DctM subunit
MFEATIVLVVVLIALLITSAPIAVALGLTSLVYFYYFTLIPMTQVSERLFNALNSFPLMAIPFFILAANIMSRGGISRRLTDFGAAMVGHLRGGMAITTVLACMFFAAVSGSSPATVVAVGALMIPAMVKNGYPKEFSTGLVATSGSLGILIPPSIPLIVFGIATEQNIGDLFLAGVLPGILAGVMLLGMAVFVAWKKGYGHAGVGFRMSSKDKWKAFRDAILALALPFLVLGGIYSGWFTPTEAAAVAVAYSLVVSLLIYREIKISQLWEVTIASVKTSAMVMFIIANGILFTFVLASERIPRPDFHNDRRLGPAAMAVPHPRQHPAALRRVRDGNFLGNPHPGPDPAADRDGAGHRPDPLRHHRGDEPRDRHDHTSTWAQPVRRFRDVRHECDPSGKGRDPECASAADSARAGDLRAILRHCVRGVSV